MHLIAKILSNYRGLHHSTLNLRDDRCLSHSIAAFLADAEPAKQTFSIAPHLAVIMLQTGTAAPPALMLSMTALY